MNKKLLNLISCLGKKIGTKVLQHLPELQRTKKLEENLKRQVEEGRLEKAQEIAVLLDRKLTTEELRKILEKQLINKEFVKAEQTAWLIIESLS